MEANQRRHARDLGMEGALARWYATTTKKSLSQFAAEAREVAQRLSAGADVLEVAPGPGYFAIELAKLGAYRVHGLDISRTFIDMARRNAVEANVDAQFFQGNVSRMPFDSASFEFVFCRAAFKNFAEPLQALYEMHRVLRPGGKALIIDLRKDAPHESIRREVDAMGLNLVNRTVTRLIFRFFLLRNAYTQADVQTLCSQTPFKATTIQHTAIGLEILLEK